MSFEKTYDRVSMALLSVTEPVQRKAFVRFYPEKKRLVVGSASRHLTRSARQYRMFWRMKRSYTQGG